MNEIVMQDLYRNFAKGNGWLSRLAETLFLGHSEIAYLSWLDDGIMDGSKNIRLLENEVEREGGSDVYFLETDEEKWDIVCKDIAVIERAYDEAYRKDLPLLERQLILWTNGYDRLKKLRKKIRARMIHTQYPESMSLTEQEIYQAREFPLEELVELNRQKRMLCPFHPDKNPSFYVNNGFGYCWSCNASCDAIRYQMDIRGMKFFDAVKSLCR